MKLAPLLASIALSSLAVAAPHDKAFWRAVAANKFAVPDGASLPELVGELAGALVSTDPEWRDDIATTTLTTWIYQDRRLEPPALRELLETWTGNLRTGIGDTGTDTVFLRSFSALNLATLAALDNDAPYIDAEHFDALVGAALGYLAAERDLRGYEPDKGWVHATAHTADLLKFLARSPKLKPARQAEIVAAMRTRLATAGAVFTHGEPERLARALFSLVVRDDAKSELLDPWLDALRVDAKALREASRLDVARYASVQNQRACLLVLYALTNADRGGRIPKAVREALLDTVLRSG
jgi:hypothetical protein